MEFKRIEPETGFPKLKLREIYDFRELLYFLIWRDVKIRYKQTKIGLLWIVFNPLVSMIIYTLFFGLIIKVPSNGMPYALFFFCGYLPWILCSEGLSRSTASILNNASVIKKVYVPKIVMPLSSVLSPLVDFSIACGLLVVVMFIYGYIPTWKFVILPILVGSVLIVSMSLGLWMCALNTQYRDFQYAITYILQVWMYASPVAYPSNLIPYPFSIVYNLNPMVFIMDSMRWMVAGTPFPPLSTLLSFIVVSVIFASGIIFFKYKERIMVDVV